MVRGSQMDGASWRQNAIRDIVMLAVVTLLLAVLGPFGTYEQPFAERIVNWAVFVFGGFVCFRPVVAGGDALSAITGLPRVLTLAIACLIASFPVTVLVALWLAGSRWSGLQMKALAQLYPYVVVVGFMILALQFIRRGASAQPQPATGADPQAGEAKLGAPRESEDASARCDDAAPAEAVGGARANALLDRIPPALGQDVLCVRNEDHYVRVYTRHGDALLLFRLSDAVAALVHVEGAQVHRSCWVAKAAVSRVQRDGRNFTLVLVNGEQVGVARSMIQGLRKAGWF